MFGQIPAVIDVEREIFGIVHVVSHVGQDRVEVVSMRRDGRRERPSRSAHILCAGQEGQE